MNLDALPEQLSNLTALAAIGMLLLAIIVPVFIGPFEANLLVTVMILGLFAMSFNLLFGYTGLLSFGQAAYFGIAAYMFAIIRVDRVEMLPELSVLPAIVVAIFTAMVLALLFGIICVQRGEIYFAMLTLALSMMIYQLANQRSDLSGGDNGLSVSVPPIEIAGFSINLLDIIVKYYVTLGVLVVSLYIMWRIVNSPYGALLIAIRENPERAEFIGIPAKYYQLSSFVLAGTFSGIAGVIFAIHNFIVTPSIFHWSISAEPLLMTLLGGPYAFFGPLLGAFLFIFLEQALNNITDYWQIGLGLILIPIVLFVPGGVASLLEGLRDRVQDAIGRSEDIADQPDSKGERQD